MVAFVGSSMASNEVAESQNAIKISGELDCMDKATKHMIRVDPNMNYDAKLRFEIYYAYYTACMDCPNESIASGPASNTIQKS